MKPIALAVVALMSSVSASAETVVITAGRMLDVASGTIIDRPMIVVEDGRITKVGRQGELAVTDGKRIDLGTLTILPGLIDMHVHLTSDPTLSGMQALSYPSSFWTVLGAAMAKRTIDAGFTTVRNVGASDYADLALKMAIERGARIFDKIIVAILVNVEKTPLFSEAERVALIQEVFKGQPNVQVETFDGLLVEYAQRKGASVLVRGLRAISDFEYEFQMALMNRHLAPGIETVFMMPAEQYTYISSRLIKEVFMLNGKIDGLVPPVVEEQLRAKRAGRSKPQD